MSYPQQQPPPPPPPPPQPPPSQFGAAITAHNVAMWSDYQKKTAEDASKFGKIG